MENLSEKEESCTVFVRGLPFDYGKEKLEEVFGDVGPVRRCFIVKSKDDHASKGYGFVQYALPEDADAAIERFNKTPLAGRTITVDSAQKKKRSSGKKEKSVQPSGPLPIKKRGKLIIRNLSFKCTEENLRKTFGKHGPLLDVNIPKKDDGKMKGFAFVEFETYGQAMLAMQALNGKAIAGRVVAVDVAISKDRFQERKNAAPAQKEPQEDAEPESDGEEDEQSTGEDSDDDSEEEDEDDEMDGLDEASDQDDDDDDDDDEEDDDEEEEEDDEEEEEEEEEDPKPRKKKVIMDDVNEGRTVFLRNLPFDVDNEDIEECLAPHGRVERVYIVRDKETKMGKGTAFVKMQTREDAQNVIKKGESFGDKEESKRDKKRKIFSTKSAGQDTSEAIVLHGRPIFITEAVDRKNVDDVTEKARLQREKAKDKRNLYLSREGFIGKDSPAASGMSQGDIKRRELAQADKKKKLQNPNFYISPNRLSVRNMPLELKDKELKQIFVNAAKECGKKKAKILHFKVVRDEKRVQKDGMGRSKGYGFVEFENHEDALACLRQVNNNPKIFGKERRPIVEFSVENIQKVRKLERIRESIKEKEKVGSEGQGKKGKKRRATKSEDGSEPSPKKAKKEPSEMTEAHKMRLEKNKEKRKQRKKERAEKKKSKDGPASAKPQTNGQAQNAKSPKTTAAAKKETPKKDATKQSPANKRAKAEESSVEPAKKKSRRGGNKEEENLEKMVSAYKKKVQGTVPPARKAKRWDE